MIDLGWISALGLGALGMFIGFGFLWHHAGRVKDASVVDVGWAYSLGLLVAWYALVADGDAGRRWIIALASGIWALRLGTFLLRHRVIGAREEDGRYQAMRRHWGEKAQFYFFFWFQFQGVANLLLTAPVILLVYNPNPLGWWDWAGASLLVLAVIGERIADNQLAEWRSRPENKGKTCRAGLWAWSRHPNYFFEWFHWVAYPVMGLSLIGTGLAGWWPVTLLGPAVMLFLLTRGTGIPYTEQQAMRSRGEDYRRYQEEVSPFIPWPPKPTTVGGNNHQISSGVLENGESN